LHSNQAPDWEHFHAVPCACSTSIDGTLYSDRDSRAGPKMSKRCVLRSGRWLFPTELHVNNELAGGFANLSFKYRKKTVINQEENLQKLSNKLYINTMKDLLKQAINSRHRWMAINCRAGALARSNATRESFSPGQLKDFYLAGIVSLFGPGTPFFLIRHFTLVGNKPIGTEQCHFIFRSIF